MDSQSSFTYAANEPSGTTNTYGAKFETELEFRKILFIEDEEEQCLVNLDILWCKLRCI
jgi:hypothetical protein